MSIPALHLTAAACRAYRGQRHTGRAAGNREPARVGWASGALIKYKIGYPTVQEDVAVVRAMRKAAGAGVSIMVDYNQCLTPAEAVARLRVLDDEGLTWVEEPTLAHDGDTQPVDDFQCDPDLEPIAVQGRRQEMLGSLQAIQDRIAVSEQRSRGP